MHSPDIPEKRRGRQARRRAGHWSASTCRRACWGAQRGAVGGCPESATENWPETAFDEFLPAWEREIGLRSAESAKVAQPSSARRSVLVRKITTDSSKLRHLVENAFLHLKRWCGIATRYAKNSASFLVAVQIRCLAIWASILGRH